MDLHQNDILTKVLRYNLIRNGRMIYIDVHQKIQGNLAGNFIAVPNLVNIVEYYCNRLWYVLFREL